jgi:hypothetical protein
LGLKAPVKQYDRVKYFSVRPLKGHFGGGDKNLALRPCISECQKIATDASELAFISAAKSIAITQST